MADITMSRGNNEANRAANEYVDLPSPPYRTSHLSGRMPAGGNIGMLDGHVEWRQFGQMHDHGNPNFPQLGPIEFPARLGYWW